MLNNNVGRPSLLDDEQFLLKIRGLVHEYKTEAEMQEILEVPKGTWDYWKWKNYNGFQDKLINYRHERILSKAETNVEILLESEDERVVADMTKFSLETLGKNVGYSKRSELTGKDGKELPAPILANVQLDNSIIQNSSTQ